MTFNNMSRSINMAIIIGNMVRDPEMRYTPQGHAVTSFAVATNRRWMSSSNEEKEETEYHNVVAWNKLAELCSQLLKKGVRVYIQGRLQTRNWLGADGVKHYRTEIVADDMVVLEARKGGAAVDGGGSPVEETREMKDPVLGESVNDELTGKNPPVGEAPLEDVPAEDIPF